MIFCLLMSKIVRCPTCKKPASFESSNRYRPFCSERCQILDLGAWADEKFAIPTEDSEISSVNKNQKSGALDHDPASQRPPKHQLN
jgi:endogenous inhibitor of DNA gyrase (YacG/DUF329 family)